MVSGFLSLTSVGNRRLGGFAASVLSYSVLRGNVGINLSVMRVEMKLKSRNVCLAVWIWNIFCGGGWRVVRSSNTFTLLTVYTYVCGHLRLNRLMAKVLGEASTHGQAGNGDEPDGAAFQTEAPPEEKASA